MENNTNTQVRLGKLETRVKALEGSDFVTEKVHVAEYGSIIKQIESLDGSVITQVQNIENKVSRVENLVAWALGLIAVACLSALGFFLTGGILGG